MASASKTTSQSVDVVPTFVAASRMRAAISRICSSVTSTAPHATGSSGSPPVLTPPLHACGNTPPAWDTVLALVVAAGESPATALTGDASPRHAGCLLRLRD